MLNDPKILIVDFGSQYTLLIARVLRDCGYRSVVLSPSKAELWMKHHLPKAVILSGSDKSVYDADAPQLPEAIFVAEIQTLGICYGMQLLAQKLGGKVERVQEEAEYGPSEIVIIRPISLLKQILLDEQKVWASHGDSVTVVPEGSEILARTKSGGISALRFNPHMWGVQFHPEVPHTSCGQQILLNFVRGICNCEPDWKPANIIADIRSVITTDPSMRAVLGFSGGVDSTTMAAILSPALGDRLLGVCIDAGQFREGEMEEIKIHAKAAGITLLVNKAEKEFLGMLDGITDAEEKRRIFKDIYSRLLKEACVAFDATHIVQGTLATDEIESGATGGALIKSHHNVGLNWGGLGELKPLSLFFKYEVRALARELGLPDSVVEREPFPGPGLFLRIFGKCVTEERLNLVRFADHQVRMILKDAKDVPEISQLVIALCCVDTTGVKGDGRAYGPAVVVRGVRTTDFMTAEAVELPVVVRRQVIARLTSHAGIVRVWFDEVSKPPATTEFE